MHAMGSRFLIVYFINFNHPVSLHRFEVSELSSHVPQATPPGPNRVSHHPCSGPISRIVCLVSSFQDVRSATKGRLIGPKEPRPLLLVCLFVSLCCFPYFPFFNWSATKQKRKWDGRSGKLPVSLPVMGIANSSSRLCICYKLPKYE